MYQKKVKSSRLKTQSLILLLGVIIGSPVLSVDSLNVRCIGKWDERPAYVLLIDDSYAYVTSRMCWDVLFVFDVSNPDSLKRLGTHELGNVNDMAKVGNYLYATRTIHEHFMLEITDVENPSTMKVVGRCDLGTGYYVGGIWVAGSYSKLYAYVTLGEPGMAVIDISNPSVPRVIGFCEVEGCARDICISGDYAYVAAGSLGVRVIDISDPALPYEVTGYDTPGYAREICIKASDSCVYVADGDEGVRVIDISIPTAPSEVGYCETADYARALDIRGKYVYVADATGGLRVIDISTPSSPKEVGYYELTGMNAEAKDVDVADDYIYLAYHTEGMLILEHLGQGVEENIIVKKDKFDFLITPNPAKKFTVISYQLPDKLTTNNSQLSTASLTIHDIAGRPIMNISNLSLQSGTHSISLDLSDVPSGIYFLRLDINGLNYKKKLLVIK